jgi:hypothetical protein
MRLAMAVGDKRHYALAEINGRHFVQNAKLCGLPESMPQATSNNWAIKEKRQSMRQAQSFPKNFRARSRRRLPKPPSTGWNCCRPNNKTMKWRRSHALLRLNQAADMWSSPVAVFYLPLINVANAANMQFKLLILLSVVPFTRERS